MGLEKKEAIGAWMDRAELEREIEEIFRLSTEINARLKDFIVGNEHLIDHILIALLAEGHVLIEGVPGTAKTTVAKSIAHITGCEFSRIQGAIDLQPADILGVRIYDPDKKDFSMRPGPVFANIVLADEINRVNPKTQSAFIEAMSERQVTIDGTTLPLPGPFFVIATQNPFEFEGTFPLIEAQRDRFMLSISSAYLSSEEELAIIRRAHIGVLDWDHFSDNLTPLLSRETIQHYIDVINEVIVEDTVLQYIRDLIIFTRTHPDIKLGGSSRASIALVRGAKAKAALQGRSYVIPDDVKQLTQAVLCHRLIITREAEIEGLSCRLVLEEILANTEVP